MARTDAQFSHTPGPWSDGGDPGGDIFGFTEAGEKVWVVECNGGYYGPHGFDRMLVLAAPDLLETLKKIATMSTDQNARIEAKFAISKAGLA